MSANESPIQDRSFDRLVAVATAARAFLKAHGGVEEWENAYEEAEDLETALQEWEETILA